MDSQPTPQPGTATPDQYATTKARGNLMVCFPLHRCREPYRLHDYMIGDMSDLDIHFLGNGRDPNDAAERATTETDTGYPLTLPVYVRICHRASNTTRDRATWASRLLHFINLHHFNEALDLPDLVTYSGDVTPPDDNNLPFLSDFLCIEDTMRIICMTREEVGTGRRPFAYEIVHEEPDLIATYYAPALLPRVHERLRPPSPDTLYFLRRIGY